jgi:DUF971 family protein
MDPRVEVDREQGLLIEWLDGHQSRFPFDALRAACPCATCRDEREKRGPLRVASPKTPDATRLARIEKVGRYAIGIVWADGHSTGIYSWAYLRERCACLSCRLARKEVQG